MVRTRRLYQFLVTAAFLIGGCAHNVEFQKPTAATYGDKIPLDVGFYMNETLRSQVYTGRSWMAGAANTWVIPVGQTVEQYANAYLSDAFRSFTELKSPADAGPNQYLLQLEKLGYRMEGQAAHSAMTFSLSSAGRQLLEKTYAEDGPSGYGRVFAGGAFAQKSAIRQSSHVIFENTLKKLVGDIRAEYQKW